MMSADEKYRVSSELEVPLLALLHQLLLTEVSSRVERFQVPVV